MSGANKEKKNWKQKLYHEFIRYWINVLYMAVFFGVFTNYRRLILAQYDIVYWDYGVSLIKALVLAKVVLVAESLGLGNRFDDRQLIIPSVYKAFLFTIFVALFSIIESLVRGFISGGGTAGAIDDFMGKLNYEWLAAILVVFFAFIPYIAVRELGRVLGERTLGNLFFKRGAAAKPVTEETGK